MFQTATEGIKQLGLALQRAAKVFAPPTKLTVSQWADAKRILSPIDSPEPGQWRTSRAEYQRGIMDAFTDPTVEGIVIMGSAQWGKTQTLNNCIGYVIDQDPGPVMMVVPTKDDAIEWSKDRFTAAMVQVTPCLAEKISDDPGRKSSQTLIHKIFPGGQLSVAWANSPSRLAARPIRYVLLDEVDKYDADPGQGDPIDRAIKRSTTFWNRKWVMCSTPRIKITSLIEKQWELSDQREYHVPCPGCDELFLLDFFKNIKWPREQKASGEVVHHPEDAYCVCLNCGIEICESEKQGMVQKGVWIAKKPGGNVAGFFIWEGYSPFSSWAKIAKNFLDSRKKGNESLKTFFQESLGQSWEIRGEKVSHSSLMERKHKYEADVPAGARVLTAAVDVQKNRLECEIKGWNQSEESWSIDFHVFRGDPSGSALWAELDAHLMRRWQHESGIMLPVSWTFIDSAGHHTQMVYKFCKTRWSRKIFPIIGRDGLRPIVDMRPTRTKAGKGKVGNVALFTVGVDTGKELIYSRLAIDKAGPGFYHFPNRPEYDDEYFAQLTGEDLLTVVKDFKTVRVWQKNRDRNEVLDLNVYALAALEALQVNWKLLEKNFEERVQKVKLKPEPETKILGAPTAEQLKPVTPPQNPVRVQRPRLPRRGNSWVMAPFR